MYTVRLRTVSIRVAEQPCPQATSSSLAADIVRGILDTLDWDQEHFIVLALNTRGRVIGYRAVHSGCMDRAEIDTRLVLRSVLLLGGTRFIVAHNHPSGDPSPSADDIAITRKLALAARAVDLELVDHIIVGPNRHVSLHAEGVV